MNTKCRLFSVAMIAVCALSLCSCSSVKGFQKQYLNDAQMELSSGKTQKFELSFLSYREGASGANGGKTGGGCGCN